jgi:hypothetical protein
VRVQGTALWKANKKDDCHPMYLRTCEEAISRLNRKHHFRNGVVEATAAAKQVTGSQGKAKAIVLLRKALETLMNEIQNVRSAVAFNDCTSN